MMEFMQYDNITDVIEDDLDCLSLEALFVELLVEDEMGVASWAK
jgi:hypothetical protein